MPLKALQHGLRPSYIGMLVSSFEHHVLLLVRPVAWCVQLKLQKLGLHSNTAKSSCRAHKLKHQRAHRELEIASCSQSKPRLCLHGKHVALYRVTSSRPYIQATLFPVHEGARRLCAALNLCRSGTTFPMTPCIKTSPPWNNRMSITRICDSVVTSALGQATQLNAERPFLLAAFTLALLCSRSYTTAPCPSSAAPINCVQLVNLTSMYVHLRPLQPIANTSQGPQSEQPSKKTRSF